MQGSGSRISCSIRADAHRQTEIVHGFADQLFAGFSSHVDENDFSQDIRVEHSFFVTGLVSASMSRSQGLGVISQRYERGDTVPLTGSTIALEISRLKLGPSALNGS